MRVVKPSALVASRNPDRFATVKGTFFSTTRNPKGELIAGEKLTIAQKEITFEMVRGEGLDIDLPNGVLSLPSGEKGRKESVGITADDLAAELESIRNSTVTEAEVEAEVEADAEAEPTA
jgi:hypothetical protein